jgi:hypothetical protein
MATFSELLKACVPSEDQRKRASVRYTYAPDAETGERPSFALSGVLAKGLSPEAIAETFRGREVRLSCRAAFANGDGAAAAVPVSGDKAAAHILRRNDVESKTPRNRLTEKEPANGQPAQV